jgi:hypothetical protein
LFFYLIVGLYEGIISLHKLNMRGVRRVQYKHQDRISSHGTLPSRRTRDDLLNVIRASCGAPSHGSGVFRGRLFLNRGGCFVEFTAAVVPSRSTVVHLQRAQIVRRIATPDLTIIMALTRATHFFPSQSNHSKGSGTCRLPLLDA